jgi:hypothetical protein
MHDGPPPQHWWPRRCRATSLLLVGFLSGSYRPRRRADQTTPGSLNLGLRSALAAGIHFGSLGAVFCDVESNDGARCAMQNALAGECRGRKSKNNRESKKSAYPHPGFFLLQDFAWESLTAQLGPRSHNVVREASKYRAYQAEELCELLSVKVATQRAVKRPRSPNQCFPGSR